MSFWSYKAKYGMAQVGRALGKGKRADTYSCRTAATFMMKRNGYSTAMIEIQC